MLEIVKERQFLLKPWGTGKQVTLLGQNVDAYGRDMVPRQTFADLLRYVSDVPGIERVRFVTSHPRYMSPRVVDAVAELPALAECFMVPFQSGDDEVCEAEAGR